MVIIDKKKNKAYENVSGADVARIIGVSASTVYRWADSGETQIYNQFEVYFNCEKMKQNKGNTAWRRP